MYFFFRPWSSSPNFSDSPRKPSSPVGWNVRNSGFVWKIWYTEFQWILVSFFPFQWPFGVSPHFQTYIRWGVFSWMGYQNIANRAFYCRISCHLKCLFDGVLSRHWDWFLTVTNINYRNRGITSLVGWIQQTLRSLTLGQRRRLKNGHGSRLKFRWTFIWGFP